MLIFDIETSALDDTDAIFRMVDPFVPPKHPGEFDPNSVKCGNLGASKAAEKVVAAEKQHAALVENYAAECDRLQAEWRAEILDKAALDAATGRVLVVGAINSDGIASAGKLGTPEETVLETFWAKYQKCRATNRRMIGFDILNFDLPFLKLRSAILGVDVPRTLFSSGRFDPIFLDLVDEIRCGRRWADMGKFNLDRVARMLCVGRKWEGECCGKRFGEFWHGTPEQHAEAQAYLHRDLELTARVAVKLGVC